PVLFTEHTINADCAGRYYEFWDEIAAGATREGNEGTGVYHEIAPEAGQRVIAKHSYDAFANTNLDYVLRSQGIQTVIICGTLTNYCCEGTARGAFSHQYDVVFGSDVCATNNPDQHLATLRTMRYGFARVMDHETILRLLHDGDGIHLQARTEREKRDKRVDPVKAHE
ncbi:MAG TPA: cysteine hydrolase, partial [Solirubrobacterales bacterium]|nr:cysteine hydrolase [Solirubrobacterales bacterium]